MTPEQVAQTLLDRGLLDFDADSPTPYSIDWNGEQFETALEAINDGNVARAAWEAVKTKYRSCRYSQTTFANGSTRVAVIECGKPKHFWVDGTDTAAFTTACAMALAEVEE